MKTQAINWIILMMAIFAMPACSNKDDFSDIMDENNLLIFEVKKENTKIEYPDKDDHTGSLYACYENKGKLDGLYKIDDTELLSWNNRTLVMVHIFYHSSIVDLQKTM